MAAPNEVPPNAYYLTASHHRDHLRKRAASCSSLSSGGAAGAEYGHTTVFPANPRSLSQVSQILMLSSSQRSFEHNGPIFHQDNVGYGSMNGRGITQDELNGFDSPVDLTPGAPSALGIEPGPATGSSPIGPSRFQTAPTPLSLGNDTFPASEPLLGPGGLTVTVTQAPTVVSKDFEPNSGVLHYYTPSSQCASPSSPNWPFGQLDPTNYSLLFPQHGSRTPSSRSAGSSPSASPLSAFSSLSIGSPSSSVGEVDDDAFYRTYPQSESQAQGEPQWGPDGWAPEQVSVSPSSAACLDNGTESFGRAFLTTPASTVMDMRALPNEGGAGGSPGPSRQPQAFPGENYHARMEEHIGVGGIEAFATDSQPGPSNQLFPSTLPTMTEDQRNGVFGLANFPYLPSGPSTTSGMAGPSFSLQVNESYEANPFGYEAPTLPVTGARSLHNIPSAGASSYDIYPNLQSGVGGALTGRKPGRSNEALRAKKLTRQTNNQLLHMSISALEQSERIPQMPSLRDTVRFIIGNCFGYNPTRQEIVDFLFEALPKRTQMEVVEAEVKKYYKDRVGHILSAPANKAMFVNISGTGRWALGDGF